MIELTRTDWQKMSIIRMRQETALASVYANTCPENIKEWNDSLEAAKICDSPVLPATNPGYHVREIPKGVLGEASKIIEEAAEFADAHEQGVTAMEILELADLYGAMREYLKKYELTMFDLQRMADVTERAFKSGERK